jgi:hypothetical protein
LPGVLVASVHFPTLALPVDELAVTGHRLPAMGSVPDAVVDEPEALARLDGEGFGVVGHAFRGHRRGEPRPASTEQVEPL